MPRPRLLAAGLLLLITLPFLGRAHSIDDPLYLQAAQAARRVPLDPLAGPSFWHERPTTLFHDLYNPPLVPYLLAPLLGARSEVRVHLLMLALAALALLVAAAAAERLGVPPETTLLLAASPALAATAVSALTDVPFLLLTLLAWHQALAGRAARAGLAGALGGVTKYAGALNPLLALAALPRRTPRAVLLVVLPPLALLAGWSALNLAQHGALHWRAAARFQSLAPERVGLDLAHFVAGLGLAGLPAAVGLLRWTPASSMAAAAGAALGGPLLLARTGSGWDALLGAAAFAAGAALLFSAAAATRVAAGPLRVVGAAFWLYAAAAVLPVHFGAARYLLPALPPLAWLLAGAGRLAPVSRTRWALSVAAGALLSAGVLWGDAGFAGAWQRAALSLPSVPGGRGLAVGHWGFQHYARERGYRALDPREELAPGDLVAVARGIHGAPASPAQRALLVPGEDLRFPSPAWRVMDAPAQAGFYSSAWGVLPFGFRSGSVERVQIGRVAGWLPGLLGRPLETPACVDLGSEEGGWVRLDGWSGAEEFEEGGARRSFVWSVGGESALRLALPAGATRLRLGAFPAAEAVGSLAIALGHGASARLSLQPGWRTYDVPIEGRLAGGLTTIVLSPAGHHAPGLFDRERRALAVALDWLAVGDGPAAGNQGAWPVLAGERPALLVRGTSVTLTRAPGVRVQARLRFEGPAALVWRTEAGESELWSAAAPQPGADVDLVTPKAPGALLLRAQRATLHGLELGPAP